MDKAEIATRIRSYLQEEFPNEGTELTNSTDLLDEWFVDSLGITEMVLFLESGFGIDVTRADINGTNFKDIDSLTEFVSGRLSG